MFSASDFKADMRFAIITACIIPLFVFADGSDAPVAASAGVYQDQLGCLAFNLSGDLAVAANDTAITRFAKKGFPT